MAVPDRTAVVIAGMGALAVSKALRLLDKRSAVQPETFHVDVSESSDPVDDFRLFALKYVMGLPQ